jgi:hypothetical protein
VPILRAARRANELDQRSSGQVIVAAESAFNFTGTVRAGKGLSLVGPIRGATVFRGI